MNLWEHNCVDGATALNEAAIAALLTQVPNYRRQGDMIVAEYDFPDWKHTFAFATAVSAMVEKQNHHPDLAMGYFYCELTFTTHSADDNLTMNDFICASRANVLFLGEPDA
jgi:4a-hydroxytetrahydrobiopterin dehydratase